MRLHSEADGQACRPGNLLPTLKITYPVEPPTLNAEVEQAAVAERLSVPIWWIVWRNGFPFRSEPKRLREGATNSAISRCSATRDPPGFTRRQTASTNAARSQVGASQASACRELPWRSRARPPLG